MIVSARKRTPGFAKSEYGRRTASSAGPTEHDVELRVAEHERVAVVDQRHAGLVAERVREHGCELEPAEPRAEDEDPLAHRGEGIHYDRVERVDPKGAY